MVHPCKAVGCRQGRDVEGVKVSMFKFPYNDPDLMEKWIQFCNRKDWSPNFDKKCDHLCSLHFEDKFIRTGKSCRLDWRKKPVPTIHSESSKRFASCLPNMKVPRKDPFPRIFQKDELNDFRKENKIECLEDLKERHAPPDFSLLRNAKMLYFTKWSLMEVFLRSLWQSQLTRSCMWNCSWMGALFLCLNFFERVRVANWPVPLL